MDMDQSRHAGDALDAVVVPSVPGERGSAPVRGTGLQAGQALAQIGPSPRITHLVAHESPAEAVKTGGRFVTHV